MLSFTLFPQPLMFFIVTFLQPSHMHFSRLAANATLSTKSCLVIGVDVNLSSIYSIAWCSSFFVAPFAEHLVLQSFVHIDYFPHLTGISWMEGTRFYSHTQHWFFCV